MPLVTTFWPALLITEQIQGGMDLFYTHLRKSPLKDFIWMRVRKTKQNKKKNITSHSCYIHSKGFINAYRIKVVPWSGSEVEKYASKHFWSPSNLTFSWWCGAWAMAYPMELPQLTDDLKLSSCLVHDKRVFFVPVFVGPKKYNL